MKLKKNDKTAKLFIFTVSFVVFAVIASLSRIKLDVELGFDKHLFAKLNAIINSTVSVLLIAGLATIRMKKRKVHENIMLTAMVLSIVFLVSYICHHLFTGDTVYRGAYRLIYLSILITHIILAAIILPFILFTAYRALTGDYQKHKKLARVTWPIWLYVSVTGVVVYLLISPYYT
jgi:putative membrane protein